MERRYPFDPYDWTTITPLFVALATAPLAHSDFTAWLQQWNELDIAVNDAWTYLKQNAYSDTTNLGAESAYKLFMREMFSTYLDLHNTLATRALALQPEAPFPEYVQLWRRWQNQTTLFHPDSIPLQAEISELESGYRELMRHIEQLPGDHNAHWFERRDELNALMLRLIKLRRELARICGEPSFLAFRWRELNRLDFSLEDCQRFHAATEEIVMPALLELRARYSSTTERPEFADANVHADAVESMLERLDPSFVAIFRAMRAGYLDLGRRPGKAVTSEQWFFPSTGMPYLHSASFNLGTTLHESGHAIHAYLAFQAHPSVWNYVAPDEFQEFAAVTLDMLCWPYYERSQGGPYTAAESAAARREYIVYDYLQVIAWGVMEDAFEHWVYCDAPEDVTPDELDAKWLEIKRRFMPWDVPEGITAGNEMELLKTGWQRWNWSLFRMPLYTIAYAIDSVAICLFGKQLRRDQAKAISDYKASLLLGNTRPETELFATVGVHFPFSQQDVQAAVEFCLEEYAQLENQ